MDIARKLPEFRAQVTDLEARLDSLKAVLPEQKDVGDLLRRLQTLATQSNLEIRGFKPQPIAQKQLHAEWPIQLELDGSYHDLGLFFDKVSKVPRIINISSLAIQGSDASKSRARRSDKDPGVTVSVTCVATTFVAERTAGATGGERQGRRRAQERSRRAAMRVRRLMHRCSAVFDVSCAARRSVWTRASLAVAIGALLATSVRPLVAQTRPAAATPAPAASAQPAPPVVPEGYSYDPEGRRDPFVSLSRSGSDQKGTGATRPDGLPGILVDEVAVRGIVLNRGCYIAMVQGPDAKTYVVRSGDMLFDAAVKAVTPEAVVFVQQVSDPLSLVKQREIRKPLRISEEAK